MLLMQPNADLHGFVPDKSPLALLIIDMLSSFDSPHTKQLFNEALRVAQVIQHLKTRCSAMRVPTIYINDNDGRWQSDGPRVANQNASPQRRSFAIQQRLQPGTDDYLVLKPRHSGFRATPLELLLNKLQAHTLIVTGATAAQCVLFTVVDAYVREFSLFVPRDCLVYGGRRDRSAVLHMLESAVAADTRPAAALRLPAMRRGPRRAS